MNLLAGRGMGLRLQTKATALLFLGVLGLMACGISSPEGHEMPDAAGLDLANASRNYAMKCAMCHGEYGKPVLATAPDLRTSNMTVEERVAIIAYGKGTMPPHRNTLDMPSIRGLAVYIAKFTD